MKCDEIFKRTLNEVLGNNVPTNDRPVIAIYPDTKLPAYTYKKFGIVNTYDLRKEFPIPTLSPIPLKNCIDELLWIWQKKSNNVKNLNSHIWDAWTDENGSIGKAYGYQVGLEVQTVKTTIEKLKSAKTDKGTHYILDSRDREDIYTLDQTDYILHELTHNPYSRRIFGNLYNIQDLSEMYLHPCCYSVTFNVEGNTLHMILNQRSADLITAGNWNVFQYALLLKLFAIHCGYEAGKMIHVISDAHIYDRHIDIAKELLSREPYDGAKLWINPNKDNFYDFTTDDFKILDYKHHEQIKNIIVAV